ncbi:MAG: disulfide bond formation protein B [Verrucomicrobia bacterium]|nr:disulfide bond formation protein B [Verrucomicrobiota bacterium]
MNLLFIFTLFFFLVAAYVYQFMTGSPPCYLCILQRYGMIGVAAALLMNCRFGIKVQHYGLAIVSAMIGRFFSLRQITLHICPEFPAYDKTVLGIDLYMWAFLIFTCSILACAILAMLYGFTKDKNFPMIWGIPERCVFWAIVFITVCNLATTLLECGFSKC